MNRKISALYNINEYKTRVIVNITDESNNSVTKYVNEYTFDEFNNSADLYNEMLDRCNAEYDEDFAEVLDDLVNKLMKEGIYNE